MKKITIGVIDDDVLFTEALELLLANSAFETLFCVYNGAGLWEALETKGVPDILLTDLKLQGENGLELLETLKEKYPPLRCIALSVFYKPTYVAAALRNGFCAFLPKNCSSRELGDTIRKVHETGVCYRSEDIGMIREFLISEPQPDLRKFRMESGPEFSGREIEIINLICMQYTNAEIAEKLFLSIRTVEGHRNRIQEKTGTRGTAGLIVYAITNALVDLAELTLRENLR